MNEQFRAWLEAQSSVFKNDVCLWLDQTTAEEVKDQIIEAMFPGLDVEEWR